MSVDKRLLTDDPWLSEKLEELRRAFEADEHFPDVVAVWEAIKRLAEKNQKQTQQGKEPYPFPAWINSYLLRCADKIGRLSLGIRPEDERPLASMNFNEVGELRKVPQSDRFRDERASHVAPALGFVRKGASAFQHHDRIERDAAYLRVYDDPELQDNRDHQRAVRKTLLRVMMRVQFISTEPAAKNRISQARTRRSRRTTEP